MRLGAWALAMLAVAASVFGQVDYAINSMLAAYATPRGRLFKLGKR